ncbi:MAG TPA: hypothetical protein VJ180_05480, partial [Pyrinomonadaceae bacterium]|nr:hypothetical protein [Pyrinomonadaceae bacterium]
AYVYALGAARLRKGELREVERLSRRYIELRPTDGAGFYLLGASLYLLNSYVEARTALERSLRLRPDADAEYLLGLTLYEEGNRAAAIERLLRVVRLRPEHAGAQAALGAAYRDLGITLALPQHWSALSNLTLKTFARAISLARLWQIRR